MLFRSLPRQHILRTPSRGAVGRGEYRETAGAISAAEVQVSFRGCANVLHLIVAARGALSSLMTEVIEDHIRLHVVDPAKGTERSRGAEELIEAVQAYLK